jgi:hypothetical protein
VVAGFFLHDYAADVAAKFVVGRAEAHALVEVVFEDGEKAGADLAVAGEADPGALSAKGL